MKKELTKSPNLLDKKLNKKKSSWALTVTIMTFFISFTLGVLSDFLSKNLNLYIALLVLIVIVFTGIIFDVIGIAIASADEKPIHAMASRKIKGASHALYLIKNADKTTNFCNDVIGDIAGIIAGATSATIGATLVVSIKTMTSINDVVPMLVFALVSAIVAAITVGGKALGKKYAIVKSNDIVFFVGKMISIIKE